MSSVVSKLILSGALVFLCKGILPDSRLHVGTAFIQLVFFSRRLLVFALPLYILPEAMVGAIPGLE